MELRMWRYMTTLSASLVTASLELPESVEAREARVASLACSPSSPLPGGSSSPPGARLLS